MSETTRFPLNLSENYFKTGINLKHAIEIFSVPYVDVPIKQSTIQLCHDFARKIVASNQDEYARRGQDNPVLIRHQIAVGKLGECGVWNWLHLLGRTPNKPDFELIEASDKSHCADMILDGQEIAVKTIEQANLQKYGASWLFEKTDRSNGILAMCCWFPQGFVRVLGFLDKSEIRWAEPRLKHLVTKKAVYYRDQDSSKISLFI